MINYSSFQVVFKIVQVPPNLCKLLQIFQITIKTLQMLTYLQECHQTFKSAIKLVYHHYKPLECKQTFRSNITPQQVPLNLYKCHQTFTSDIKPLYHQGGQGGQRVLKRSINLWRNPIFFHMLDYDIKKIASMGLESKISPIFIVCKGIYKRIERKSANHKCKTIEEF